MDEHLEVRLNVVPMIHPTRQIRALRSINTEQFRITFRGLRLLVYIQEDEILRTIPRFEQLKIRQNLFCVLKEEGALPKRF